MPAFLVALEFHHNSNQSGHRTIHDIPDGADPNVHALLACLGQEHNIEPDQLDAQRGQILDAYEKAVATGEKQVLTLKQYDGDDEGSEVSLWYYPQGHPNCDGKLANFGVCSDEATWLTVEPYVPDPQVKERLEAMDKAALVDLLLRVRAERGYLTLY